jgi:hypothetical protein
MERNISDVIVVGSGASGVHAAAVLAEAGCAVTMLDGGYRDETYAKLIPERSFLEIRRQDWQQHRYLLGDRFEGIDLSPIGAASHVTPPRQHILRGATTLTPSISSEFAALESLALGGLGGTWGAVSFPFTRSELTACGLALDEMQSHYESVAHCIGVSGSKDDDLVAMRGPLETLQRPLEVDSNARAILDTYRRKRELLHRAGARVGRSLMAILSEPLGSRRPNPYHDMDYWSNSGESVYRPDLTLRELLTRSNFSYQRSLVESFEETSTGRVKVFGRSVEKGEMQTFEARALLLAAGALGTARIVLRSLGQFEVPVPLTCNSHTYVPCLIPWQLGRKLDPRRHSLAQLTLIYDPTGDRRHLVQAQYYPYRSLLLYRLLKESPLPYRESLRLVNAVVPAFGIWLIQHEDFQGTRKFALLHGGSEGKNVLEIKFRLDEEQEHHQKLREKRMLQLLRRLGCWPLKRIHAIHGSSAHYGSTFPFSDETRSLTTQPSGRLNQTRCIYIADGSSFRYLPAKGLTLTLMANARRVGATVLQSLRQVSDAGRPGS